MTLRFRISITLLDEERDPEMQRAARRLLLATAAELIRASARMENHDDGEEGKKR